MNFIADAITTAPTTQSAFWMVSLLKTSTVAQAVVVLSIAAATGLALGSLKIKKIGLGIAGVLFSGLIIGHFLGRWGVKLDDHILEFAREFGLILFVYSIGIQVGPGFLGSLRRDGLPLNLMAAGIVLLGTGVALVMIFVFGVDVPVAMGMLSGATTNTPSLAAAQQALQDVPGVTQDTLKLPGLGYAVCYPFGIMGIILSMLLIRRVFKISPQKEAEALAILRDDGQSPLTTLNMEVRNPSLEGMTLARVPMLSDSGVVISRVMHGGETEVARSDTVLHLGDVLHAVGTRDKLDQLRVIIGQESKVDLKLVSNHIVSRRVLVTQSAALGKSIAELNLPERFSVNVTRVNRAGVDLAAVPGLKLQFADNLVVVGDATGVNNAAAAVGDSVKRLNHPQIIPIFIGIALGVLLGSWPIAVPGMPAPIKLGLAGGPLIVAIILSRMGNIGPLVWYMPLSANLVLREIGIVLFLAAVGIRAGDRFIPTLTQGSGLYWMLGGMVITFVPLMIVGLVARAFYKLNYLTLCGLLAGSMTDPPALAFATSVTNSDSPSVAYATVYPLTMILRVLSAQAVVMFLMR